MRVICGVQSDKDDAFAIEFKRFKQIDCKRLMVLFSIKHYSTRRIAVLVFTCLLSALQAAHCQNVAAPDPAPIVVPAPNVPLANPFESEVSALEARLSQSPISSSPVVFYGSSSIRLWKSLQQDFSGYAVLNCGFGGSRLSDCVRYANRLVLPRKPSAIVIYAGDNDLAGGTPPEKVFQSFSQLFTIFRTYSPSIPIAFVSVKVSPARLMFLENILKFNRLVEDFLKTQPETEYIDVCSDMLGQDRKPIQALFVSDQIHLSPAGYQILRKEIGEFLSQDCPRAKAARMAQ
jgi:lysophospholipase L1-like esterase